MDKPRHPMVIRPWKTERIRKTHLGAGQIKLEGYPGRPDARQQSISSKVKTRKKLPK